MFDIGWSEMVFVAIIAVLVIGPKDLPRAIATIGKYIRKARSLARDFQSGIDDLAKEAELDDIKKSVQGDGDFNLSKQIEDAVNPTGDFEKMFDDIKPEITETPSDETTTEKKADTEPANSIAGDLSEQSEPPSESKVS
ncbi:MAG: Sec-independent protein translocase protein TatB [Sneathiellales bacterium]|nr:Sec-independent protein translocase protein TatB [Sneathiellales bacterium]